MALWYFLFCYITTLTDQADSYVLLAANLDDFRSIAKKFVPEKLADQIADMAAHHRLKQDPEYFQESELSQQEPVYEDKTETYKKPISRYNVDQNAAAFSLDEIVEKVKQRLQNEFQQPPKNMVRLTAPNNGNQYPNNENPYPNNGNPYPNNANPYPNNANPYPTNANPYPNNGNPINQYDYGAQDNGEKEEPAYADATYDIREKPSSPRIHQGRLVPKRLSERNQKLAKQIVRYVETEPPVVTERQVNADKARINKIRFAQQPTVPAKPIPTLKPNYLKLKRQRLPQNQNAGNKKLIRRPQPKPTLTITKMAATKGDGQVNFEGVDMLKSNDSYEDYVTPPKEEPYETDDEIPKPQGRLVITFKPMPSESRPDMEEPLAENIEADMYENEPTDFTPAEVKARTESLIYDDNEPKVDPNVTTTPEADVKGKKPKMKIGTMIPTRERYSISSPNYYAKLPTIAEKYNFNEPIPEQDREPENLNPIGLPPSNINGKILVL